MARRYQFYDYSLFIVVRQLLEIRTHLTTVALANCFEATVTSYVMSSGVSSWDEI
jgi:hypothetical protein